VGSGGEWAPFCGNVSSKRAWSSYSTEPTVNMTDLQQVMMTMSHCFCNINSLGVSLCCIQWFLSIKNWFILYVLSPAVSRHLHLARTSNITTWKKTLSGCLCIYDRVRWLQLCKAT